jgi:hypothetical protein
MTPLNDPPATSIAAFGGAKDSGASRIDYSVPLPGASSLSCIHDLSFSHLGNVWTDAASNAGNDLDKDTGLKVGPEGQFEIKSEEQLRRFIQSRLIPILTKRPVKPIPDPGPEVGPETTPRLLPRLWNRFGLTSLHSTSGRSGNLTIADVVTGVERQIQDDVQDGSSSAGAREVTLPVPTFLQDVYSLRKIVIPLASSPRIWVIEEYEIASYLGNYGLGAVVSTLTLLPGEEQVITVESWRENEEIRFEGSSIFDSYDEASQDRFMSSVEARSASTASSESTGSFYFSKTGKGGWDAIFASHSETEDTKALQSYRISSDTFVSEVSAAVNEHAAQSNVRRENSISSAATTTSSGGLREFNERRIRNTNLRRTLNFVYRELNQEHDVYVVLKGLKVAFGNGRPGSLDVVELPALLGFLKRYIVPTQVSTVLAEILRAIAVVLSFEGDSITVLQMSERDDLNSWADATVDGQGNLTLPAGKVVEDFFYRFKPLKKLQTSVGGRTVAGVVRAHNHIVLRTDSVIGESLLGEGDALDPYAAALQEADIIGRELVNKRTATALQALDEITDPIARAHAFESMFVAKPNVQLTISAPQA